jgi:hypothetical protein
MHVSYYKGAMGTRPATSYTLSSPGRLRESAEKLCKYLKPLIEFATVLYVQRGLTGDLIVLTRFKGKGNHKIVPKTFEGYPVRVEVCSDTKPIQV